MTALAAQPRSKRLLHPPFTLLGEDGIQIAFEQLAGVGEVLLGIGDRSSDPLKRFIENGDNALLFGKRRKRDIEIVLRACFEMLD